MASHGLANCVRVRRVGLADAWPELRQAFTRHHLCFEYKQAYETYEGEVYLVDDEGDNYHEFERALTQYLQMNVQSLYACEATDEGDDVTVHVFFEQEEDLVKFTKNFLVLHKLSN